MKKKFELFKLLGIQRSLLLLIIFQGACSAIIACSLSSKYENNLWIFGSMFSGIILYFLYVNIAVSFKINYEVIRTLPFRAKDVVYRKMFV